MNDTAETNPVAQPTDEGTNVEASLDDVLGEYDQATQPKQVEQPDNTGTEGNDDKLVLQYVKQKMYEDAQKEVTSAVNDAIKTVKEVSRLDLPDKALQGYLNVLADENPRFRQAFLERDVNPARWQEAVRAAGRELAKPAVDENLTQDANDVVQSISRVSKQESASSSERPLSEKDFNRMSDAEFKAWERANMT